MRLLSREFPVATPLNRAWDVLVDVRTWPRWAKHIRSVRADPPGPVTPATVGELRLVGGIRSSFRMKEFVPGRHWVWEGRFLWLWVTYDHVFEAIDPQTTRIRFTVDAEGLGVGFLGQAFARIYARNLDRAIPNLVELIQRERVANK